MIHLPPSLRLLLIGGTSHAGKSTLAQHLASTLGWEYRSTDKLARHPGRPWANAGTAVPPHVAEHYATLSVDDLLADVLRHYQQNVLPQVATLVRASDPSTQPLVLEGSALWPEFVAPLLGDQVAALWLIAGDDLLTMRMHAESHYAQRSPQERLLIDKFLARTLAYAHRMDQAISDHGLLSVRIHEGDTTETLAQRCLHAMSEPRR